MMTITDMSMIFMVGTSQASTTTHHRMNMGMAHTLLELLQLPEIITKEFLVLPTM